jgi:hypothetical protein
MGEHNGPLQDQGGHADLGVRSERLPAGLGAEYYVESSYEDEVLELLANDLRRVTLLRSLAGPMNDAFGCDSRLMLAAPYRLFDPIGTFLQLVIFTHLTESESDLAFKRVMASHDADLTRCGVELVPIPVSRLKAEDRQRLGRRGDL